MSSLKTKNNNLLALKAQQLLAEQLPGGELTVNVIKTLMKPENLKRLAVALIGGMLKIKPMIIIDNEGKLEVVAKARGRLASMKALVKSYENEQGVKDVPKIIFIGYTGIYEDARQLKDMLEEVIDPGTRIDIMCETPIIGVHTGPDFFSICGWGFHRKEA